MKTEDFYREHFDKTFNVMITEKSKVCTVDAEEYHILNKAYNILWKMYAFVDSDDYFSLKLEKENGKKYTLDKEAEGINLLHAVDFLSNFYRKEV